METIAEALKREGREEGIALGMEKGIEQRNIDIAKNMLANNFDIGIIKKITELTVEQIKALKTALE